MKKLEYANNLNFRVIRRCTKDAKPYSDMGHSSGNGHVYNTLSFNSIEASTFAAAWSVSSATITSLNNAAQRVTATLLFRTTKLLTGMAQCRLFRRVSLLHAIFWHPCPCLEATDRLHVACLHSISTQGPY